MGKKKMMKKFPFLSKTSERWRPWPSCAMSGDLKTHSFRGDGDGIFKILNSAYNLDSAGDSSSVFSGKVEGCSSTASYEQLGSDSVEKVIRGLRSERLVFTPEETSSMAGAGAGEKFPFKESVAMEMDSTDPITDFKRSMEEMVEAHDGLKDWEFLEGLLICYLRINGKSTHGYIVGAFVDLLDASSVRRRHRHRPHHPRQCQTLPPSARPRTPMRFQDPRARAPVSLCGSRVAGRMRERGLDPQRSKPRCQLHAAEEAVKQSKPPPSCIVSDMLLTWTAEVAAGLNIPRLVFNGSCCFSYVCQARISDSEILGKVGSEWEQFTVPEVAHNIQVCKAQVKGCTVDPNVSDDDPRKQWSVKIRQTSKSAYGVIVNSFDELEPDYVKEYRKMHDGRVWCVGPVSLCDQIYQDQLLRGNNNNYTDQQECLKWLHLQAPGSVVYVSFGSMASLSPQQMAELALALESNKRPFLWALGKKGKNVDAFEDWNVSSGFEQRNKGIGLLVRGWAPQVLILSHTSVGGFLTHCGWNSTLEAISAKVPMITWPLIAEQFLNEKLVVEVLGIGVSLGLKMSVDWDGEDKNDVVVVKNEEIKEAIDKIMDEGGIEIRKKDEVVVAVMTLPMVVQIRLEQSLLWRPRGGFFDVDPNCLRHLSSCV
nr:UDP-glycosyltransferase 73C3-like [Ipomoea batatas]